MDDSYVVVETVYGRIQGEILRGLLEAAGISAHLDQESAGAAIGLGVGPLGEIRLSVPASLAEAASDLIQAYYAGELDSESDADVEGESTANPG